MTNQERTQILVDWLLEGKWPEHDWTMYLDEHCAKCNVIRSKMAAERGCHAFDPWTRVEDAVLLLGKDYDIRIIYQSDGSIWVHLEYGCEFNSESFSNNLATAITGAIWKAVGEL